MTTAAGAASPAFVGDALVRMGLAAPGTAFDCEPLAGGVSSDIYRVTIGERVCCIKRALPRLKVAADWRADPARNRFEVAWLRFAREVAPTSVPEVLGEDVDGLAFAMTWLDPARHPVWKSQLRDGHVDPAFAAAVGTLLGRLHGASAGRADLARMFATDGNFHAIRLEPYLEATALAHADLAAPLRALVARTASTRRVLVHGDVSPKNILAGPDGPVLLDAECAWYGDPAFDLAFCLNHLLLKGAWRPASRPQYVDAYLRLADAYLAEVHWEPVADLEARAASLLPGLMLARIDGKSPVEYLDDALRRDAVRQFARPRVAAPPARLANLAHDWARP